MVEKDEIVQARERFRTVCTTKIIKQYDLVVITLQDNAEKIEGLLCYSLNLKDPIEIYPNWWYNHDTNSLRATVKGRKRINLIQFIDMQRIKSHSELIEDGRRCYQDNTNKKNNDIRKRV